MRAIDADELIEDIQYYIDEAGWSIGHNEALRWCIEFIEHAPNIKPDRKTGKWERHYSRPNVYADLYWHCSECGYKNDDQYANIYHNFCPACGSDMRGNPDD